MLTEGRRSVIGVYILAIIDSVLANFVLRDVPQKDLSSESPGCPFANGVLAPSSDMHEVLIPLGRYLAVVHAEAFVEVTEAKAEKRTEGNRRALTDPRSRDDGEKASTVD